MSLLQSQLHLKFLEQQYSAELVQRSVLLTTMPSVTRSQRGMTRIAEDVPNTEIHASPAGETTSPANASTPTQEYGSDGENVPPSGHADVQTPSRPAAEVSPPHDRVIADMIGSPSAQILRELSAAVDSATRSEFPENVQDTAYVETADGHPALEATTAMTAQAAGAEIVSEGGHAARTVEIFAADGVFTTTRAATATATKTPGFNTRRLRSRSVIYLVNPSPKSHRAVRLPKAQLRPTPPSRILRNRPVKAPQRYVPDPDPTRREMMEEAEEKLVKGLKGRKKKGGK